VAQASTGSGQASETGTTYHGLARIGGEIVQTMGRREKFRIEKIEERRIAGKLAIALPWNVSHEKRDHRWNSLLRNQVYELRDHVRRRHGGIDDRGARTRWRLIRTNLAYAEPDYFVKKDGHRSSVQFLSSSNSRLVGRDTHVYGRLSSSRRQASRIV
jgi:hypothetical protein